MTTPSSRRVCTPPGRRPLASIVAFVLLPFALAHFLSYLYRNVNAMVYPELARELRLDAGALGWLTSAYLLVFALAQLPIGVILDRYGARRGQAPLLLIAAAGAVVFACAHSLAGLVVGRGLIGLGVAGSLMAAIKASSQWLPRERLPLATSLLLAVGGLGAMASTAPMHIALRHIDWREAFIALGGCTLIVSALIYFAVPEQRSPAPTARLRDMSRDVGQIYRSGAFWRLALYSIFAHATYMAVQGLWMGAWLRDAGGLDSAGAAGALLGGTVMMVAGSLCFGWLTDWLKRYRVQPVMVCGGGIALFVVCQAFMIWGGAAHPLLIACAFTFFGASAGMNYAIVARSVPAHLTARVSTSFNLLLFLLAFLIQAGLGAIIARWPAHGGAYPLQAWRWALGINLALQCPGLLLWLTFRPWQKEAAA